MGNGLTRVSPTNIPQVTDEKLRKSLKDQGLKMEPVHQQMMRVTLPDSWGIYCEWDRRDIWRGFLIDQLCTQAAHINWMSKGRHTPYPFFVLLKSSTLNGSP